MSEETKWDEDGDGQAAESSEDGGEGKGKEAAGVTDLNRVMRLKPRGVYEQERIDAILDAAFVADVGFDVDVGPEDGGGSFPCVVPMLFARRGREILLHGSSSSRLLKHGAAQVRMCVTVTLMDGLVLARSLFSSSANYRSVMMFGHARVIRDQEAKKEALMHLAERIAGADRARAARGPSRAEMTATDVLIFEPTRVSAKVRAGPPEDTKQDLKRPELGELWAGVIPLGMALDPANAIADSHVPAANRAIPASLVSFCESRNDALKRAGLLENQSSS